MDWQSQDLRGECSGTLWSDAAHLRLIDPYLVWFDLTGFAGVDQAARQPGCRVPVIAERPGPHGDEYHTLAQPLDRLDELRAELAAGRIRRFELGLPLLAPEPLPAAADAPASPGGRPVVGFIDFGCAFANRQFRVWQQGHRLLKTRVAALWDQAHVPAACSAPYLPLHWARPGHLPYGAETRRGVFLSGQTLDLDGFMQQFAAGGQLDEALCYQNASYAGIQRAASHGTHMVDLATGFPRPWPPQDPTDPHKPHDPHEADIVFVQLPRQQRGPQVSSMLRAQIYDGIRYILAQAAPEANVVINLSYGGYAGPHDGSSTLDRAIDALLRQQGAARGGRLQLVVAAGNARKRRLHASVRLAPAERGHFHLDVMPDDPTDSFIEFWLPEGAEKARLRLLPPGASRGSPWVKPGGVTVLTRAGQRLAGVVHARQVCQSSRGQMVLVALAPTQLGQGRAACPYGRWTIEVEHRGRGEQVIDAWCERDEPVFGKPDTPRQAQFHSGLKHEAQVHRRRTLSSLAHGRESIVVGGCVPGHGAARYSSVGPGRGLPLGRNAELPDTLPGPQLLAPSDASLVEPGIPAAATLGTDKIRLDGSSVATALTTRQIIDRGFVPPDSGP